MSGAIIVFKGLQKVFSSNTKIFKKAGLEAMGHGNQFQHDPSGLTADDACAAPLALLATIST